MPVETRGLDQTPPPPTYLRLFCPRIGVGGLTYRSSAAAAVGPLHAPPPTPRSTYLSSLIDALTGWRPTDPRRRRRPVRGLKKQPPPPRKVVDRDRSEACWVGEKVRVG